MSLPFSQPAPTAGRPPRADGPPVIASRPEPVEWAPGAATGPRRRLFEEVYRTPDTDPTEADLIARLRGADWSDRPHDDVFPDLPGNLDTGPNLAVVVCFVVATAIASAMVGIALGYLTALL